MYLYSHVTKTNEMQNESSTIVSLDFSSCTSKHSKTGIVSLLETIYSLPAQLSPQKEESN